MLFGRVGSVVGEVRIQESHWIKRPGRTRKIWIVFRQTSTRTDRIRDRHLGQRIGQLRIFACKLSSWGALQRPPLLGVSGPDIDDEGCAPLAAVGLGGIGHGGCEIGSCDEGFGGDVAAGDSNRRMPTW